MMSLHRSTHSSQMYTEGPAMSLRTSCSLLPQKEQYRTRPLWAVGVLPRVRSEEHTSELQSLMRISYAVFCLKKKNKVINDVNTPSKNNKLKRYTKHTNNSSV